MAKDRSKHLTQITFHCKVCCQSFKKDPDRIEDAPDDVHYPYEYFSNCPHCNIECELAGWQKGLLKAWSNATGPKTDQGKAATAENLKGHPTPEESLRTRFNAMKHGLSAKVATYFPSKPDGYSFCNGCDVDRVFCKAQPACVKKTELFMLHQAAFEQRNPKHLMGIYSELHSAIFAVVQTILQEIIADGVKFATPKWFVNKDGQIEVAEYFDEDGNRRIVHESVMAHPLFRPLGELLSRSGLTLADMGMTQKVIEAEEDEMGRINAGTVKQEELNEYKERQLLLLKGMADKVMRSNKQTANDPILMEYQNESGSGE
jgi:hypothetical protein